ncbi:MAG TPA: right-handed parallel beta-helix repeat-containing protein [Candidatus Paceibacterota bacterium]|nr:right-handed parallel beta-helix repeat-containing protein [Candidatus Paceibacterota bacterium]
MPWLLIAASLLVVHVGVAEDRFPQTRLALRDGRWIINQSLTNPGSAAEGLLMNVRVVNAVFEDRKRPEFDPEANTDEFIARLPDYAAHGVNAFTLCLQGGMPGYEGAVNSAFDPDGTLRPSYLVRVERVVRACDRHGLAVILGLFYQRQSGILRDEAAVRSGAVNAARWVRERGFANVLLEIANEYPHGGFVHALIRDPKGQASLIRLAKEGAPGLLVSASGYGDGTIHPEVAEAVDFLLPHWNGTKVDQIPARITALKRFGKPIVCNEDDKIGPEAVAALRACVGNGASYGLMLKECNQTFPFRFAGAADDPVFYAALRAQTTPRAAEAKPPPQSTSGSGLAPSAGEVPTTAAANALVPASFSQAPPLPPPRGEVLRVATVEELLAAVERVEAGGAILLADGHYRLPRAIVLEGKRNIALRSASGDPARVTLSGQGWESGSKEDDLLHIGHCEGVTVAHLSFADCRSYGIKVEAEKAPKDIQIYDCRFRDIGVRAIKGSAGQDPNIRAVKGSVRYCQFENTKVPPADWLFGGDYIAAIDMMALEDWHFSDNLFRNIRGRNGGGRAAIFLWVRSQRVVVERNLILNCDRGVAFGNPGQSTANLAGERLVYVADGIIRNNFIAGGPDCGIELWYADRIKVLHNTIWRPEQNWRRGIRVGTGTAHTELVNNLVHGEIIFEGGEAQMRHNLTGHLEGYFVSPASGNLALTREANGAIDQGVPDPEATEDISGRPRVGRPDLGAWESRNEL